MQPGSETIAVLICTHRRPTDLLRCLAALREQSRPADDILIVVRPSDRETHEALLPERTAGLPVRVLPVYEPGLIAARNVGLAACKCSFIAMTDDDTAPHPDWLAYIVSHFRTDPKIGGVGGRDRCMEAGRWNDRRAAVVGALSWFGRMSGYHHLGFGNTREVAILKGTNMSYRMSAVGSTRAETRLRGSGAQAHEDAMLALTIRRKGWRLIYDPAILVDHYEAVREEARHYGGIVPVTDADAFKEGPYNWAVVIWAELSPWRQLAFLAWNGLVGTRVAPGFVQAIRFTPKLGRQSWYRFRLTQAATWEAYRELLSKPLPTPVRQRTQASKS